MWEPSHTITITKSGHYCLRFLKQHYYYESYLTSVNIRANDVFVLLSLDSNIGSHLSKNIIALWILASRKMNFNKSWMMKNVDSNIWIQEWKSIPWLSDCLWGEIQWLKEVSSLNS